MLETLRPDPTLPPVAAPRDGGRGRTHRLYGTAVAGRVRGPTRWPWSTSIRRRRPIGSVLLPARHAESGRRVPSLRLERLQLGAVAAVGPCLPAAPLPDHPGHPLVAHLRRRHPARPGAADDRQDRSSLTRSCARPAIRARTPCTAGPRASTSAPSAAPATTARKGRPACSSWIARRFEIRGRWEIDRGPQKLHYDFWWNLPRDYMVSSEWGLPPQFENGIVRRGPARPTSTAMRCTSGTCAAASTCRRSTSAPITRWRSRSGRRTTRRANTVSSAWWSTPPTSKDRSGPGIAKAASSTSEKTATIPPEPADAALLPALLKGFGAVPPLISDIDLSLDDRFLYVACWGTGELRQYDVTDPMQPALAGSVRIGGIAQRTPAPERQAVRRRPADDRDQPRRQARLLHQLALQHAGTRSSIPTACPACR